MASSHDLSLTDEFSDSAALTSQLLSNGRYTVLVTEAGTGYSSYDEIMLTRWVPDRTRDADGFFFYVRDETTGAFWSAGLQPVRREPEHFAARFSSGVVELEREDDGIETVLKICVVPDAGVELRRITFSNHTDQSHRLQLTSYAEVVLNTAAGDAGHPAFSKLFVQTSLAPDGAGVIAKRRPRSPEDRPLWLEHRLWSADTTANSVLEYETDRARFIGRGRTLSRPRALDRGTSLSGTVGSVLDPVLSIRRTVDVAPGQDVHFVAVLAASTTLDDVELLAEQYGAPEAGNYPMRKVDASFDAARHHTNRIVT